MAISEPAQPGPAGRGAGPKQETEDNGRLDALLDRIQQLTTANSPANSAARSGPTPKSNREAAANRANGATSSEHDGWLPTEPESITAAGLNDGEVEALILKTLNGRSEATGRNLSDHLKLSFRLIDPLLHSMKQDRL